MSPEGSDTRQARKAAFAEGFRLREEGDIPGAISALRSALEHHPEYAPGWLSLGDVLYRASQYNEAADCFRQAVRLRPDNELASSGLFFTLVDAGRVREATEEATRFLERVRSGAVCDPELLQALVDWLSEPQHIADGLRKRKS